MDYLDPKKQARHRLLLFTGYVLIAVGIVIGTIVLLYQAYGFGLGKNGSVIQNGLLFVSSQPHPAKIYLNGQLNKAQTNARITLPANEYQLKLTRTGYDSWQRTINLEGGSVRHFDYPLLVPSKLTTTDLSGASYAAAPSVATQSLDKRWLLVSRPENALAFDLFDLKHPTQAPTALTLPKSILSKGTTQSWQFVAWADDNVHVLLQHVYDGKTEYILLDRSDPAASLNLTNTFDLTAADELSLLNKKYDQYELYNTANQSLSTLTLKAPTPVAQLSGVIAFQTYGNNQVLYVTAVDVPTGKVQLRLLDGGHTYDVHTFPANDNYLVNMTTYSGTPYVVASAASQDKVYIFKDPVAQLRAQPTHAVVPIQVLHVTQPTYLSFSNNAQFIMAEAGSEFAVYDLQNQLGYHYATKMPLDAPQVHASWMDGDRLTYVSAGRLIEFDYDDTNEHQLISALPAYLPAFAPDYTYIYTLAAGTNNTLVTQTSLLTAADR